MHLVGFVIIIYHDARSPERQILLLLHFMKSSLVKYRLRTRQSIALPSKTVRKHRTRNCRFKDIKPAATEHVRAIAILYSTTSRATKLFP